jgi:hypothetical protein
MRKPTSRERILNYGRDGAGKTYNYLMIAEALPDVPFFVIDTDDTTERMLEDEFSGLTNVKAIVVQDWEEFEEAIRDSLREIDKITKNGTTPRQDLPWLIVDPCDYTWDWAQEYFVNRVFDSDIDEYFIQARRELAKDAKKLNPLEGWVDWQVINRIFQGRWNPLTKGRNYHLFLTTKAAEVRREDKTARELYDAIGSMPAGEKRMGYRVHTVLYSVKTVKQDIWQISTSKDRGREMLKEMPVSDFAGDYLEDIAGWKL